MKRIHVGQFNDSFPPSIDGVAQTVKNYAHHLHNKHCDITVVTPRYPDVVDNYPYEVYRYQSLPTEKMLRYRMGNPFGPKPILQLRKKKFDLIHIHAPFASSVMAATVDPRHRIPIVMTYHTKFEYDMQKQIHNRAFYKVAMDFMLYNINRADEIWAVTDGCGKALQNIGYKGDYYVMENGTDFPFGRSDEQAVAALRERYGIDDDTFVFLFVGRMMWYKNTRIILDAMRYLKQHGLPFRTFMIGSGVDLPDIQAYAAMAGVADEVIFTGPIYDREELRVYYSMTDLFVFPSTYDTSGLVVKEAAACSCASLMVRDSCASEGARHNENAFLAEENGEDIGRVILDACQSRDKLRAVGMQAGKDLYLSWEDAVERAYKRYGEILKQWPGPLPYNGHKNRR